MKDIPAVIKDARVRKGMTQADLALAMGYETKTGDSVVRKWENGVKPVPIVKIRLLASVLDLTVDDLIP